MKNVLSFFFLTLLFSCTAQISYKTYMSTIADFRKQLPYFSSNDPRAYVAWGDTIAQVVRNNKGQVVQLTVRVNPNLLNHAEGRWNDPSDSLKLYTFSYNAQDKLEHVKIRYRSGEPAYFFIYDSDIRFSEEQQLYDDRGRRCGYRRYADTILIEERRLTYDDAGYTISDYVIHSVCEMRDSVSGHKTYSYCNLVCDTVFRAAYRYNDDYHTIETSLTGHPNDYRPIPEKPGSVQLYRFNLRGDLLEESTVDESHPAGRRMVFEYNDRGKLLSYRFCDTNYRLIPEWSDEPFSMRLYVYNRSGLKCRYIINYDAYGRALEINYGPDHWNRKRRFETVFDKEHYLPLQDDIQPDE
jgi:hypothetical protein